MKSSSAVLITLLGASGLLGCEDIIGTRGTNQAAGSAGALAPPPPAAKAAEQPAAQKTAPSRPHEDVGSAAKAEADAKGEAKDESGAVDEEEGPIDSDLEDTAPDTKKSKSSKKSARDDDDDKPTKNLSADLSVKRLVIAKGVKGREPVGATSTFVEGAQDRIYAFVEVGNRDQVASELYITFVERSTGKGGRVPIQVGAGARWRTWVHTKSAKKPGKWRAVVKNAKGKTLASANFEITAGDLGKSRESEPTDDSKDAKAKKGTAAKDAAVGADTPSESAKAKKKPAKAKKASDKPKKGSDKPKKRSDKAKKTTKGGDKAKKTKGGDKAKKTSDKPKKAADEASKSADAKKAADAGPSGAKADTANASDAPKKPEAEKADSKK